MWDIEDAIRGCEREGDFGPRLVKRARSVYKSNDRRADLKRRVSPLLGSGLIEEKSSESSGVGAARWMMTGHLKTPDSRRRGIDSVRPEMG